MDSASSFTFDSKTGRVTVRDIDYFPREILDLAGQVKILDMSTVRLGSLPEDLGRLTELEVAFFSSNDKLEEVPQVLASCVNLKTLGMRSCNISVFPEHALPIGLQALILTDNKITQLPRSIGECTKLKKLMIAGNQLRTLPKELLLCQNLEIVRFSANNLDEAPDWLLELPRLAWYADASNPFSLQADHLHDTQVSWHDVTLSEMLGKSVNNIVYRGRLGSGREVAVKIYGHDLVTDGLPIDDMSACLRVGDHANVIGGIGELVDAPHGEQALVMPLISSDFKNLGSPPSLSTICRDIYTNEQPFSFGYIYRIILSTAAGMRHLHAQGVMHGDFYAHNVLTSASGESYVGDFGAASLYERGSAGGILREQVDVRAFGILIDELMSRCDKPIEDESAYKKLDDIKTLCLDFEVRKRPSFAEIYSLLTD